MTHFIPNTKENLWILNRKTLVERQTFQTHPNRSNSIQSNPVLHSRDLQAENRPYFIGIAAVTL